jgi:hypothetical protein
MLYLNTCRHLACCRTFILENCWTCRLDLLGSEQFHEFLIVRDELRQNRIVVVGGLQQQLQILFDAGVALRAIACCSVDAIACRRGAVLVIYRHT